jgi:hypothetical protein
MPFNAWADKHGELSEPDTRFDREYEETTTVPQWNQ